MRRLALCLAFLGLFVLPPLAARAADSFTVADVKVDATAASASEAATQAINAGQQKAWSKLIDRLVPASDRSNVPQIDNASLQRMIRSYQVSNELRSTTRYKADVTYEFNGDMVRRFLRDANVAYAANAAPALLIVPMAPNYDPGSDWAQAWSSIEMAGGAVPLTMPMGDALDKSILGPVDFNGASWSDVQPVASRTHTSQVALAELVPPSGGQATVKLRILTPDGPQVLPPVDVPVADGTAEAAVDAAAASAAAQAIANAWQSRSAIDFNQRASLTAEVRLDSLRQWGTIQQRLAQVPVVTQVKVVAMNMGHARIVLNYAGTPAQLNDFLSQAALALSNRDGVWWLSAQNNGGGTG